MEATLTYMAVASMPALLLSAVTWRLVWPRWKRVAKLLLHPCLYAMLALLIGPWSVPIAWVHQGIGLAGHVWFSKQHGFTWYAVEDPAQYVALSQASVEKWGRRSGSVPDREGPTSDGRP